MHRVSEVGKRIIELKTMNLFSCRTEDEIFSRCLTFYWASDIANSVFKRILGGGYYATALSAVICMPGFFYFALIALFSLCRKLKRFSKLVIPALLYLIAFAISVLRGTPLWPMPNLIMWGMLGLFLATVVISIADYNVLYIEFRRMIPLYLVLSLLSSLASKTSNEYMMHFSYMLLLPMCICFYELFEKKHRLFCVPFVLFLLVVLLFGARGPLVSFLAFVLLQVFIKSKKVSVKALFVFLFIIGLLFYSQILSFAARTLDNYGISSRTIWILINDPSHTSGREALYIQAQKMIDMRPIVGWGVAGERVSMDVYPHSIIYEFLIDYGEPLGYFLLFLVLVLLINGFCGYKREAGFFYTYFISASIALFWSGSYLSSFTFWISIYMAVSALSKKSLSKSCVH